MDSYKDLKELKNRKGITGNNDLFGNLYIKDRS